MDSDLPWSPNKKNRGSSTINRVVADLEMLGLNLHSALRRLGRSSGPPTPLLQLALGGGGVGEPAEAVYKIYKSLGWINCSSTEQCSKMFKDVQRCSKHSVMSLYYIHILIATTRDNHIYRWESEISWIVWTLRSSTNRNIGKMMLNCFCPSSLVLLNLANIISSRNWETPKRQAK